jgi:NDP-sugar pyrophosphorylase family protein
VSNPLEYGIVITDSAQNITSFLEKPGWGEVFSDTVNTGIYVFEPEILKLIPENTVFDFSKDLFPKILAKKEKIIGYNAQGYWCDIGSPGAYLRCCIDAAEGKIRGIRSQFSGERSIIGQNCHIDKSEQIKDSVLWDNIVIDKYCNLTASYKDVNEDLEQRAFLALNKQQSYYDMLEVMQSTIENANQGISTKLSLTDFEYMIRTKMPAKDIITEINKRAERIKQSEIVAAEKAKAEVEEKMKLTETIVAPPMPIKQEAKPTDTIFFVELRFEDTKANIEALAKYLKDNGFNYTTLNKGKVK